MCLSSGSDAPPTPEPVAPPAAPAEPSKLEVSTKTKRRSDEISSRAKGTRRYRNDSAPSYTGSGMSGLNIPS
jgi:hypothetical protein